MKSTKLVSEDLITSTIRSNLSVKEAVELIECNLAVGVEDKNRHEAIDCKILDDKIERLVSCGLTVDLLSVKRQNSKVLFLADLKGMQRLVFLGNYEICNSFNKVFDSRITSRKVLIVLFEIFNAEDYLFWKVFYFLNDCWSSILLSNFQLR
jgi:hypothetical protein